MNFLEERIAKDGIVKEGNVLKVDSFLNHQMDIRLFDEIGAESKHPVLALPVLQPDILMYLLFLPKNPKASILTAICM